MIFVGDDGAEDHHDVHLMDEAGQRLATRRLPEGLPGIRDLHELIARHAEEPDQVMIGIETDRGLWFSALAASGYQVWGDQPDGCCPQPRPSLSLGCEVRCWGCQSCWPTLFAPIGTTTVGSPGTPLTQRQSKC